MQRSPTHLALSLLILLVTAPQLALADKLSAWVDRDRISADETLQLIVDLQGHDTDRAPDVKPLERDFDLLSQSRSMQINIINGREDTRIQWRYSLAPKRSGQLTIPSLRLGSLKSNPVSVEVTAAASGAPGQGTPDFFLEMEAEPVGPYVQAQVIYTLRLFQGNRDLTDGSLDEPRANDVLITRLGQDRSYQSRRNGRSYRVIERTYALFPQRSGPLTIPAVNFRGRVAVSGRSRLFQSSKPLILRGEEVTLQVRPTPAHHSGWWLPASAITLEESWSPENPTFRVGEPVTRTLTLSAAGVTGPQLPALPRLSSASINGYPDQPEIQSQDQTNGVMGQRIERIALVPTQAGELTLPAIEVPWWDTKTDEARVALLPERTITVLPAPSSAIPPDPSATPSTSASEPATSAPLGAATPTPPAHPSDGSMSGEPRAGLWPQISATLLLLWLLTLGWITYKLASRSHYSTPSARSTPAQAWDALRDAARAARKHRASETRAALLRWIATLRGGSATQYALDEIANELQQRRVTKALNQLDEYLYSSKRKRWNGVAFWERVATPIRAHTRNRLRLERKRQREMQRMQGDGPLESRIDLLRTEKLGL